MYCRFCGKSIADDSQFCSNCGRMVVRNTELSWEDNYTTDSITDSAVEGNNPAPDPNDTSSIDRVNTKPLISFKLKRKRILSISAVAILIIALIIFAVLVTPKRIEVSHENYTLIEGDSVTIDVNQFPKLSVIFPIELINHNDNVAKASLENGKCSILAISPGACTLSLKSVNGRYATCYITVKAKPTPLPTLSPTPTPSNNNSYSVSDRFLHFSFDGSTLDPCGFLSIHNILKHDIRYYLEGLVEGEDYNVKRYSASGWVPGFTIYEFYPLFQYIGVDEGHTAIQIDTDESGDDITSFAYLFLVTNKDANSIIQKGYSNLKDLYGVYDSCTYTSMQYSNMGIQSISISEFFYLLDNETEGMYHIQWIAPSGMRITLGITLDPQLKYYQCEIAYAI